MHDVPVRISSLVSCCRLIEQAQQLHFFSPTIKFPITQLHIILYICKYPCVIMCLQIRFEGSELSWQLSWDRAPTILWVAVRWRYQSHVNLEIAYDNLEFQVVVAQISRLGRSQNVVQQPPGDTQLSTKNARLWSQETRPHWTSEQMYDLQTRSTG